MNKLVMLLVVVALSPIAVLGLHIVLHRVLASGGRHVTGHASAMRAIAAVFAIVMAWAWWFVLAPLSAGWLELAAGVVYVTILYGAVSLLYVNIVNIAETSLHMHTLLEVAWAGRLTAAELYSRYNAVHMVTARLDRLTSLGQIGLRDGRYFLASRSLLRFANTIVFWHYVIRVPLPPLYTKPN